VLSHNACDGKQIRQKKNIQLPFAVRGSRTSVLKLHTSHFKPVRLPFKVSLFRAKYRQLHLDSTASLTLFYQVCTIADLIRCLVIVIALSCFSEFLKEHLGGIFAVLANASNSE